MRVVHPAESTCCLTSNPTTAEYAAAQRPSAFTPPNGLSELADWAEVCCACGVEFADPEHGRLTKPTAGGRVAVCGATTAHACKFASR